MNKRVFSYLEMAGQFAVSKDDRRNFILGACAIRGDGVLVSAFNSPTEMPNRKIHAEYRLAQRLDYGATVYVARIKHINGELGIAKPCHDCMKVLRTRKVKKVYYSISNNEYGVISF